MPRLYTGIEPGLSEANRRYIQYDRYEIHRTKIQVARIAKKIISAMKRESPLVFAKLYSRTFGGGSSYEGLRVGEGSDFDIDILFKIPEETKPVLHEDTIRGCVQLELQNFHALEAQEPELFRAMSRFVDNQNFLLTTPMKTTFMQSIFDRACHNFFPRNVVPLGERRYEISRVQNGPAALTLTIRGLNLDFFVEIDLVPCILLTKDFWPKGGFKQNPYSDPSDFFIVPKGPKRSHPHLDRYFRLSFQMQERKMIFDRNWLKPTIRIIKRMRDHFQHQVSSYAIKTLFLRELHMGNPDLDDNTPDLWKGAFSDCLVHMLQRYLQCLTEHRIKYFWNKGLNLLESLSQEQINTYRRDVERMLNDIMEHPIPATVLNYLS